MVHFAAPVLALASLAAAPAVHHAIELEAVESCAIEPVAAADDLASLLPADAVATLRASSLRRALRNVMLLTGKVADDDRALLEFALSDADVESGPWIEQLDLDRPCAAAVAFQAGGEPEFTIALPAHDPQALISPTGTALFGLRAHTAGNYIVMESAETASAAPALESSAFAALVPHDLAFQLDLQQIRNAFGPLIDMGFDQAESSIDSAEENEEAADVLLDGLNDARQMWKSADSIVGYLNERSGRLEMGGDIAFVGAEWVTKRYGAERYDLSSVARLVDPDAALSALWSGSRKFDATQNAHWMELIEGELGENIEPLARLQTRAVELATEQAGPLTAMNLSIGVDGMFGAVYLSTADSAKLVEQLAGIFGAPEWNAMGLAFTGPHESTVQGVTWREYVAAIEVAKVVEALAPEAEFDAESQLQAQRAVEAFFGHQGLRVALSSTDGFAIARLGGDERYARATSARLARPTPALPPQFVEALERTKGASTAVVSRFDLGLLLQQASEFAAGIGQPMDVPTSLLGLRLPITVHGALSPEFARGGVSIDSAELVRFIQALEQDN